MPDPETEPNYDYSQVSSAVGMILRRHIKAAADHGDDSNAAAINCSMAVMAPAIGTLAAAMGRAHPSEATNKRVINSIIKLVHEMPK